jgi:RNA polymerase sigma-70 factor (ECF subfamily)
MQDISRDILIQASKGDIGAFEQIYKASADFVYNVAFRITCNRDDAQEVTQDVFLKIYNNLKKFQFRSSFKTWIYRIAVNSAINTYRRMSREQARRLDFDMVIKSKPATQLEEQPIDKQDREHLLMSLLKILNPDQRACIVLREIEGLDYKQIAVALDININTVRSRLKRAREALMAYVKKRGDLQ